MNVGSKLKSIRENRKITQQEAADYLSISQKTYSNIESNKSKLRLTDFFKLSELFDFYWDDFFKEKGIGKRLFASKKDKCKSIEKITELKIIIRHYQKLMKDKEEIIHFLKSRIHHLEKKC